jgi:hypothetical protein
MRASEKAFVLFVPMVSARHEFDYNFLFNVSNLERGTPTEEDSLAGWTFCIPGDGPFGATGTGP